MGVGAEEMPGMLVEAFDGDRELLKWVGTLRASWQREIAKWVMEPKSEEARVRRCGDMAERLLLTMEAERELPPALAARMRRSRNAMAGWEQMTRSVKITYLLVLFGTKSAEAREKQTAKLVEACVAKGQKVRR